MLTEIFYSLYQKLSIMDLILTVVKLLRRYINGLVVEVQEVLEVVKLQDKGQLSYIISYRRRSINLSDLQDLYIYLTYLAYLIYLVFLRRSIVYLKDYSPYLASSFLYSESQNIIGVNLLGNHSTSYYYVVNFLFTYIPSLLISLPQFLLLGFVTS